MLGRLTIVLIVLVVSVVGWVTPAEAAPLRVYVTASNGAFSPNGDGSKDLGGVRYRLTKRAYVTVRVSRNGRTVLLRHVGRRGSGTHYFVWNGVSRGRVVPDARYAVRVVARRTRHGKPRAAYGALTVDARYGTAGGRVRLSSGTVYPRTTVIRDVVVGNFLPDDDNVEAARFQVLAARNRVVDSGPLVGTSGAGLPDEEQNCYLPCGRLTWDGQTSHGAIAPAGSYRIRLVRGTDAAGNPRVLAPLVGVRVSTTALVARTTSLSLSAGSSTLVREPPYDRGCNGCPEVVRSGSPSSRHPGGLTYLGTCPDGSDVDYCYASDVFVLPLTLRRTPSDTFTLVAHGGPSTAGDDDTGTLSARSADGLPRATMQGDTTGTLSGAHFSFNSEVPAHVRTAGLQWSFGTSAGASYDLSSFDLTYTTYVPTP